MSSIEMTAGRPVIVHHGKVVNRAAYLDRIMRGDWKERVQEFVESGVTTFGLNVPHGGKDFFDAAFWTDEGVFPESDDHFPLPLARQAELVLEMCPEARLFIVCMSSVPKMWSDKHADHMQTDEDGKTYREASLCSRLYLDGLAHFLRTVVDYCQTKPWADRVFGYYIYPYGEGAMPLNHSGKMFDCSAENERQFRSWLARRYGDDAALQSAWGDEQATLAGATVPRDQEWLARRASLSATLGGKPLATEGMASNCGESSRGLFHWLEAANVAREHDYCWFMRDNFLRWVRTMHRAVKEAASEHGVETLVGFDITKLPLMGWQIQSAFDGVGDGQSFPNNYYLSGAFGVSELLDELDIIVTPADYHARTLGFAFEAEGVSDSMVMRGKVMVIENDTRCYVGQGVQDQGAFRDDSEVEAGLARNAALVISRGLHDYWCNVGSSYFHAPGIHETIRRLAPVLDGADSYPHRETRDAIALVLDDESPLHEDFTSGYQSLAVIWQRIRGLAHCGIPYRIYLLSDLRHTDFPDYKVYLFPNLFKVDDEVLGLLKEKVLRNGNLAIFGPSTGITDGRYLTAEPASRLLGVPMEMHPRLTVRHVIVQDIPGHPITAELPAGTIFGDSLPYGPTLTPRERAVEKTPGATCLGHGNLCWFLHRTGMFIREAEDHAILWSCAMPLPSNLLRAAARHAGCNVWCEEDDVVYASDSFVALHSVKNGNRTLHLPRKCRVRDAMTGTRMAEDPIDRLELKINAPQTRMFWLD